MKPFLVLTGKDFVTGIAPSAHSQRGGLFFKAEGISPINEPGQTESVNNWLLRAGPDASDMDSGGTVVLDNAIAKAKDYNSTPANILYSLGVSGHFYKVTTGLVVTDLRSGNLIANASNGMFVYQPVGGTKYLYYFQNGQIGRWDLSGTYPTGWTDAYYSTNITSTSMHPTHHYYDRVFFGNGAYIGSMKDDGAAGVTITPRLLSLPSDFLVTAISDDGIYLYIGITKNTQFTAGFSDTRVLIWDTNTSTWQREYQINDEFIHSLTRVGNTVFAQGKRGIYEVSFGGIRKVLPRLTGLTSTGSTQTIGPNLAQSYNQEALLFAHSPGGTSTYSTIGVLGKISSDVPAAFFEPIRAATANQTISLIETQFVAGKVIVASNNKLYSYSFSGDTALTGVSGQTIYFDLPQRMEINRIDCIFGEPLVSGDTFDVLLFKDEDTLATAFGTASYSTALNNRRRSLKPTNPVLAEQQVSLQLKFTLGTPKLKRIEVYGIPREATN